MATNGKCNSMLNPIMFMTSPFLASITQAPHCGATVCRTHLLGGHTKPSESRIRVQPSVTFPIGDHVNVLHDYKKMRPSKILKLLTCRCHHLIDMLIKCSQNLVFLILLKCLNVPSPSMFTNLWQKNCQISFCLLKSSKNPQLNCQQVLPANTQRQRHSYQMV